MKKIIIQSFIIMVLLLSSNVYATTYYIDYATGSDTNSGLSKSTPWKHAPGMAGATGNPAATTPQPGDNIILKGGVTWPNSALGWVVNWSGSGTDSSPGCSGSSCIYIGVDKTWYSGSSWSRPVLDAGGKRVAAGVGGVQNVLLRLYANYLIIDNIEFTGLYWDSSDTSGTGVNIELAGGTPNRGTDITIENIYVHGWSHDTYANGATSRTVGILGDTGVPNNNARTIVENSVFDGSDTDRESGSAIFGSPPYIENNLIQYVSSGIVVNGAVKISGNSILHIGNCFDTAAHTNGIEINASNDVEVSDNSIGDLASGTVGLWVAPNEGYTATVFNNIIYNTYQSQYFNIAAPVVNGGCQVGSRSSYCAKAGKTVIFNNTIECGPDDNPTGVGIANINIASSGVTIYNNQFITSATTPNNGAWSVASGSTTPVTASNNLVQTKSLANQEGYAMGNKYPFYFAGTSGSNGDTLNAGKNLTGILGIPSEGLKDTSCGVDYDEVNHKILGPKKINYDRGENWDIGAYQVLLPPTNVIIQ